MITFCVGLSLAFCVLLILILSFRILSIFFSNKSVTIRSFNLYMHSLICQDGVLITIWKNTHTQNLSCFLSINNSEIVAETCWLTGVPPSATTTFTPSLVGELSSFIMYLPNKTNNFLAQQMKFLAVCVTGFMTFSQFWSLSDQLYRSPEHHNFVREPSL